MIARYAKVDHRLTGTGDARSPIAISTGRTFAAIALGFALCLAAPGSLAQTEAEEGLSGAQAFAACVACHSLAEGAPHKVGPNLHGVVGRKAAAAEGYSYSPALSESGITWTRDVLFAFIAVSETVVPGNWMLYHNVLDGSEALRLIDYLAGDAE